MSQAEVIHKEDEPECERIASTLAGLIRQYKNVTESLANRSQLQAHCLPDTLEPVSGNRPYQ